MGTRDKILHSAVQLFGDKGYHATSIQDISNLAGVTKGAVFHYFPSKNEILFEIHDVIIEIQLKQYEDVLRKNHLNPSEKLFELINILLQIIIDYRPYGLILFQESRNIQGDKVEIIKAKRDRCEEIVSSVIKQGVVSGEFRQDLDIAILTKLVFGACNWSHHWLDPEGQLAVQEIAETIWKVLIEGLIGAYQEKKPRSNM